MSIYEYAHTPGTGPQCCDRFEVFQRMADAKLTACPVCGQPCERQISAVALGGKFSTSDSAVANSGFTKYKKRIGISNHLFPDPRRYRRPERRSITRSLAMIPRSQ